MRISDWCSDVCSSDLPPKDELLVAVERLERDRRPEDRLGERHRHLAAQVEPVAGEALVVGHPHVHVEVAVAAATGADRTAACEPPRGAGVDARRAADGVSAHIALAPLAAAGLATPRDAPAPP